MDFAAPRFVVKEGPAADARAEAAGLPPPQLQALECRVSRGHGWSPAVRVTIDRAREMVLQVER
jgi:hypothetical protein